MMTDMDLRDWFAGQALAGLIATRAENFHYAAVHAYMAADVMMEERRKHQAPDFITAEDLLEPRNSKTP